MVAYEDLIRSAVYSAYVTYGLDTTKLRVFAQDYIASLNRKGIIPNEKVDEALNSAYEYISFLKEKEEFEEELPPELPEWYGPVESRRYGQPRTEEERLKRHFERYGTIELPPRGTGLQKSSSSQIPTCPICGKPMKKIIGKLYQCPDHPFQTATIE